MTAQPTVLVTGVSGQDGIHLSRELLASGRRVVGTVRPGTAATHPMLVYLDGVTVVEHDLCDTDGLRALLELHRPVEVYNLASWSRVGASWGEPELVAEVNGRAVERAIEALVAFRDATSVDVRFFQASSAEELGEAAASPYAQAKTRARAAVRLARDEHALFACAALLHNHESPLRGAGFVTRKISRAAAEIGLGRRDRLSLGNLAVSRDWGAARDYVTAMRLMLTAEEPMDLVIGTGLAHTLEELLETAFGAVGIDDPMAHVDQDPALLRPLDAGVLVADPEPADTALGWRATTDFETLVREMVAVDVRRVESGIEESPTYLPPVG